MLAQSDDGSMDVSLCFVNYFYIFFYYYIDHRLSVVVCHL